MDISDYFVDPNPDRNEWIKRKIMATKWELRRTIEELEFLAEQYQINVKYKKSDKEIMELKMKLKETIEHVNDLANQIKSFS